MAPRRELLWDGESAYHTRPPARTTRPVTPIATPAFASCIEACAFCNEGSFAGPAQSPAETEQFEGTPPRPAPRRMPPVTAAAAPAPDTASGSQGFFDVGCAG